MMSALSWLLQIVLKSFGIVIAFIVVAFLADVVAQSRLYEAAITRLKRVPWRPILLVGIPLLLIGAIVAEIAYPHYSAAWFQRSYAFLGPRLQEFRETASGDRSHPLTELSARSLLGVVSTPKIVAITIERDGGDPNAIRRGVERLDPIMLAMPPDWRPRDPQNVNLVVACRWSSELRGAYSSSINGYVDRCRFSVYDLASGTLLFTGTAEGGPLPPSIKRQRRSFAPPSHVYGDPADANVVEQIRQGLESIRDRCIGELDSSSAAD